MIDERTVEGRQVKSMMGCSDYKERWSLVAKWVQKVTVLKPVTVLERETVTLMYKDQTKNLPR
jgi:hypothetical protein